MNNIEQAISEMDFEYFGTGRHKIEAEAFLNAGNTVLLDVRAKEETEALRLPLRGAAEVMEIPCNEVPERINEIPKDRMVGIFCSAGIRAAIIFIYLKGKGFDNVRIIPGGYIPLAEALMPGKLYKRIKAS